MMKLWYIGLVMVLAAIVLAGCGGEQATPAPADEGGGETYASDTLDTSYPGALNASSQLALGTIQLEETEQAVTSEQAASLLPLWQALQGGVTAQAEVNAVLKQVEGTMAQEQLATIAAMQLTQEDLRAWMQEQGLGAGAGFPGAGGDMSEEEREAARATRQAGGGGGTWGDQGGEMPPEMATRRAEMENMSEEEREALRATMQAGGGAGGRVGTRVATGGRQFAVLLNPLIELLTQRAAE
jgi:hypothetical protein